MAKLIFIDSFDHYSASQMARKWSTLGTSTIVAGRTGNGMRGGALEFPSKTFNAEYTTMTMGLAYNTSSRANAPIRFLNATNSVEVSLSHVGDGRLQFLFGIGSGTTNVPSPPSTFVLHANEWYYLEMQAAIVSGGPPAHLIASARVNEAEILTWDYTASFGAAGASFNRINMQGPGAGLTAIIDDLYVTDTEFLGDVRIGVLYPNAVGDSSQWVPNAAGANWQQVEEHPADDDTTYVSTPTVGQKDLYNLDDIDPAFVGTIKGVQALWCVKKSDEGSGAVKGIWKSGSTEIVQSDGHNYIAPNGFFPSAANYLYDIETERKSLFTAADWTKTELNGLQLGITRTV